MEVILVQVRYLCKPLLLAADVDDGSSLQVRLGLPQDLVGDRSGIPLPEEDVADHVHEGVALRPTQVAVGSLAGFVTQVQEKRGYGVGHHRALPPQYSVSPHVDASHLKHFLSELRGVFHVDLQKQHRHILRDVVVLSLFLQLPCILFWVVGKAAVGDDVELILLAGRYYEPLGLLVYLYALLTKLERAPHPGSQRDDDYGSYEEGGDFDAVGALEYVRH